MSNIPFIAFYPGKWLGRTATLSAIERGVFITLICEMYERMEPLKRDEKALARLCGCTPKTIVKCIDVLLEDGNKIILVDGRLWNDRVQKEIENAQKKSEVSRQNISRRWQKNKQKQTPDDTSVSNRNYYLEPEPEEKDKPFSPRARREKKNGFIKQRTAVDAAMAAIERRSETDGQQSDQGNSKAISDDVQRFPAIGFSGR